MTKLKTRFNLIQIIFILLIAIGVIIIIFFSAKIQSSFSKKNIITNNTNNNSISQEEYSQWNVFNNSEMKYLLKYPQDWVLEKTSPSEIYLYSSSRFKLKSTNTNPIGSNIYLKIYNSISELPDNSKNLNLSDWIKFQDIEENIKEITINGIAGYEIFSENSNRIIFFQKENLVYSIFDSSAGKSYLQQQIISSLEFN